MNINRSSEVHKGSQSLPDTISSQPRICILGGGIAGCTLAHILSNFFPVVIFERNSSLLTGASNMWWKRIHTGVHFPHEPERGVLAASCSYASALFFKDYLLKGIDSRYYCARKSDDQLIVGGKKLTPDRFIEYVKYVEDEISDPKQKFPQGVELLGSDLWSLCSPDELNFPHSAEIGVNTNEGVLDLPKFAYALRVRLEDNPSISINLQKEIKSIYKRPSGETVIVESNGTEHCFDVVIDTTRHLPTNRIDKKFRQFIGVAQPTPMDSPELRLYAVVKNLDRNVKPCYQYLHGKYGVSYAYLPNSNKAIVEALPDTIVREGKDNDELLTWMELLPKDGPINQLQYSQVAKRIFDSAQKEYPAFSCAELEDYFVAPMIQPAMVEHDQILELLLSTPGKDAQIDPTGYFHFRNLKVTDTILLAFHVLQQLSLIHPELGLKKEAETKTPAEFGYWLMKNYPDEFIPKAIELNGYKFQPSLRNKLVESYC